MEHEQIVRQAAASGMSQQDFTGLMREILRRDAPPVLRDKDLDEDSVSSHSAELLSGEQALCHLKGAGYVQHVNGQVSRAQRDAAAAQEAMGPLKADIKKAVNAHLVFLRNRRADGQLDLIVSLLLAGLVLGTVCGEVHLLVAPLADWMGVEHLDFTKVLWLGSAAAVVLSFLGLLAHEAMQESNPVGVRATCGAALVVSSLLIGQLRSSQAPDDSGTKLTFYLWWCWISFGAPIVTARLIEWLWPRLRSYLVFKAEERYFLGILRHVEGELAELRSKGTQADEMAKAALNQFTEAYQDLAFADARRAQLARGARRQIGAMLARCLIAFRFWTKEPACKPVPWLVLSVMGALALLAVATVLHAEEPVRPAAYTLVLCDRSDSSVELACSPSRVAAAFDAWALKAMESRAGQFDVMIIGSGVHDVELALSEPAPRSFQPPLSQSRRRWLRTARQRVLETALPAKRNASAILEGIYAASFRLSGLAGHKELVIMTDLRQVSGRWNFERRVPEDPTEWLGALPGKPELHGVRISVCGFHTASVGGSKTTVPQLMQLRRLWSETFKHWGIPDVPILEECDFGQEAGGRLGQGSH